MNRQQQPPEWPCHGRTSAALQLASRTRSFPAPEKPRYPQAEKCAPSASTNRSPHPILAELPARPIDSSKETITCVIRRILRQGCKETDRHNHRSCVSVLSRRVAATVLHWRCSVQTATPASCPGACSRNSDAESGLAESVSTGRARLPCENVQETALDEAKLRLSEGMTLVIKDELRQRKGWNGGRGGPVRNRRNRSGGESAVTEIPPDARLAAGDLAFLSSEDTQRKWITT